MPDNSQAFGLNTKLNFGKYKGSTVQEIIKKDPEYLGWAEDTIDWFVLDDEAESALDYAIYEAIDWD